MTSSLIYFNLCKPLLIYATLFLHKVTVAKDFLIIISECLNKVMINYILLIIVSLMHPILKGPVIEMFMTSFVVGYFIKIEILLAHTRMYTHTDRHPLVKEMHTRVFCVPFLYFMCPKSIKVVLIILHVTVIIYTTW